MGRFENFNHRLLAGSRVWRNRFHYETDHYLKRLEQAAKTNSLYLWGDKARKPHGRGEMANAISAYERNR